VTTTLAQNDATVLPEVAFDVATLHGSIVKERGSEE
jgi:hypothetical protein